MRRFDPRLIIGSLFIIGGLLALLQSFGLIAGSATTVVWTVIFGAGAFFFLLQYSSNREAWWPLIPGLILLGLTLSNILELVSPTLADTWGGFFVLAGLAIAFWVVYLVNRANWWGAIPGGILATLAVVSVLDSVDIEGIDTGGIFLIGLGLTFLILTVLPNPHGRMSWALFPALPLLLLGGFVTFGANEEVWNYIWPSAIILLGAYFLLRGAFRR